MDIVNKIVK